MYAQEALDTALTMYIEEQRDLPNPSPANGHPTVSPNALECAKLDIYLTMSRNFLERQGLYILKDL